MKWVEKMLNDNEKFGLNSPQTMGSLFISVHIFSSNRHLSSACVAKLPVKLTVQDLVGGLECVSVLF